MIQFCHEKNGDCFERALNVTVEAFARDPLSHWIVRQERLVQAFNAYGILAVFSAAPQAPHCWMTENGEAVVAAYQAPEEMHESTLFYARHALKPCWSDFGIKGVFAGLKAAYRYWRYCRKLYVHQRRFSAEHQQFIYIYTIATRNDCRGKGFGRAVMDRIFRAADEAQQHVYLEATSEQSRAFYQRLGFIDYASVTVDTLHVTVMTRPPRRRVEE